MNAETKIVPSMSSSLVRALAEIGGAAKDKVNPHFKSKYADLASVVDAIKPVLAKHGLAFTQGTEPSEGGVIVETFVWCADSEPHSLGKLFVPANKNDAQGFGSALTYARRYGLMTAFGVPAEDDDGNAAARSASTDEPAPKARMALDGPYKSPTALQAAIKAFAATLDKMTDLGDLTTWMQSPEVVELDEQAMRDLPGWWDTGEGCADEFEPMTSRIHRKKRALEESENIHGANILHAG